MSSPDSHDLGNIIQSPEAEAFLRMVTKGFYKNSRTGLWIFEVIGREWDEMRGWAEGLRYEINPQTCTWSVDIWEWVYGIPTDKTLPLAYRRQRIIAKVIGVKPINPEVLRRGVAALMGGDPDREVEVTDFLGPYRFDVILHPSGRTPLNYSKIYTHIREVKPSHLAFEVAIETKVDVSIQINTIWNWARFGMTGEYNCGTRPGVSVPAQLRDVEVTVDPQTTAAAILPERAGTVYASGNVENPQRMNPPSTVVRLETVDVEAAVQGGGFAALAPPTSEERKTGQHPQTSVKGGLADTGVTAAIGGAGYPFGADPAGTKPNLQRLFVAGGTAVGAEVTGSGYPVTADRTGTKPQESTRLELRSVEVRANIENSAYRANLPPTTGGATGQYPHTQIGTAAGQTAVSPDISGQGYGFTAEPTGAKAQTYEALGAQSGGVSIETDSFPVSFKMCGTDVTRES